MAQCIENFRFSAVSETVGSFHSTFLVRISDSFLSGLIEWIEIY